MASPVPCVLATALPPAAAPGRKPAHGACSGGCLQGGGHAHAADAMRWPLCSLPPSEAWKGWKGAFATLHGLRDMLRLACSSARRDFSFHTLPCMQVCERQASDKKGGHLARRKKDGRLM